MNMAKKLINQIHDNKLARDFLNSVPFDEYVPDDFPICSENTIVLGWFNPGLVCCFPCQKINDEIEIHVACKKKYRGKVAVKAGKEAIKWIFKNTDYKVIFSEINARNNAVYARLCGLSRVGSRFEVRKWASL